MDGSHRLRSDRRHCITRADSTPPGNLRPIRRPIDQPVGDWTNTRSRSQNRRSLHPNTSFVFSELLKSSAWAKERVSLFHYRDKDQVEVDFVLENTAGEVVGIEAKAAASVTRRDFAGLDRIAASAGAAFMQGILLYDGKQTLSFGDKLRAVPLSALWGLIIQRRP